MSQIKKARAEIPQREWVEFELSLEGDQIKSVRWSAQACHEVLEKSEELSKKIINKKLNELKLKFETDHASLLISEIWDKLLGKFEGPSDTLEICHCRKVNENIIDHAIVLGAHTPEKVRAWTMASSGCGTCRNEVAKLIARRLKIS